MFWLLGLLFPEPLALGSALVWVQKGLARLRRVGVYGFLPDQAMPQYLPYWRTSGYKLLTRRSYIGSDCIKIEV